MLDVLIGMERRFILTTAFIVELFVKVFSQTCPPPTLWKRFAKKECSEESLYHCLKDEINQDYTRKCIQPIRYPAGNRVVYHNNLNAVLCDNDRYQPDPYWSNEVNNCIYKKSTCNEEGQLIYSNGTSTSDRSCLCDYTRGYAFITAPKHINFCVPSIEDCQCYVKICPKYNQALRSDYSCGGYTDNTRPTTTHNVQPTKNRQIINYDDKRYRNIFEAQEQTNMKIVLTILICWTIVMFLLGIICVPVCMRLLTQIKGDETPIDPKFVKRQTQLEIRQAKEKHLFVSTKGYRLAADMLKNTGFVLLKGRYGSGKTISALHLASDYVNRGYEPYRFELANTNELKRLMMTPKNRVIILENVIADRLIANTDFKGWEQILQTLYPFQKYTKLIVTSYQLNKTLQEHLVKNGITVADVYVDLDSESSLSLDDKRAIFNVHYRKYGVPCFEDTKEILVTDPVFGFPLMCSLFCNDDNNRSLGKHFFTQAPTALVEKFEALRTNGVSNRYEGVKYSVLVYIALSKDDFVDVDNTKICIKKLSEIFKTVYNSKYRDGYTFIENAANEFTQQCLIKDGAYKFAFRNHGIKRAILITYGKIDPTSVIKESSFDDLISIIRPNKYIQKPAESSLKLAHKDSDDVYVAFATRFVNEILQNKDSDLELEGNFIKDYIVSSDDLPLLENILNLLKLKTKSLEDTHFVQSLVTIFQQITNGSKDCLPLRLEPICFRLTWEMVCAAKSREITTFEQLVQNAVNSKIDPDFILASIDPHRNTLLHYLVIWGLDAGLILLKRLKAKDMLVKNKLNFTPHHFAAYLARPKFLTILLDDIDNKERHTVLNFFQKVFKINSPNKMKSQFEDLYNLLISGKNKTIFDSSLDDNIIKISDIYFGSETEAHLSLAMLKDAFKTDMKDYTEVATVTH